MDHLPILHLLMLSVIVGTINCQTMCVDAKQKAETMPKYDSSCDIYSEIEQSVDNNFESIKINPASVINNLPMDNDYVMPSSVNDLDNSVIPRRSSSFTIPSESSVHMNRADFSTYLDHKLTIAFDQT
eukprot:GFUD01066586.1.p1 GENE.GFUD01066586.1~~GFUD01066586.1.p1  ORF type:complete len:128 (-),score=15.25 GFUD01066586.1:73-456(-)